MTLLTIEMLLFIKKYPLKCISDNTWLSTNVGAKLLSDLVIFSIFSPDIPLNFHELIRVVPLKYLIYLSAVIKIK